MPVGRGCCYISKQDLGGEVRHRMIFCDITASQIKSPLKQYMFSKSYCPQSFSGGGLYLNVNWLLWSVHDGLLWMYIKGYYGACMMGYYDCALRVTMERVWLVTMFMLRIGI